MPEQMEPHAEWWPELSNAGYAQYASAREALLDGIWDRLSQEERAMWNNEFDLKAEVGNEALAYERQAVGHRVGIVLRHAKSRLRADFIHRESSYGMTPNDPVDTAGLFNALDPEQRRAFATGTLQSFLKGMPPRVSTAQELLERRLPCYLVEETRQKQRAFLRSAIPFLDKMRPWYDSVVAGTMTANQAARPDLGREGNMFQRAAFDAKGQVSGILRDEIAWCGNWSDREFLNEFGDDAPLMLRIDITVLSEDVDESAFGQCEIIGSACRTVRSAFAFWARQTDLSVNMKDTHILLNSLCASRRAVLAEYVRSLPLTDCIMPVQAAGLREYPGIRERFARRLQDGKLFEI